jgi:hypothetical protein
MMNQTDGWMAEGVWMWMALAVLVVVVVVGKSMFRKR